MHWNHEYVGKDYRAEIGFVPRYNIIILKLKNTFTDLTGGLSLPLNTVFIQIPKRSIDTVFC